MPKVRSEKSRIIKDKIFKIVIFLLATITIIPLFLILYYIVQKGLKVVSPEFLLSLPKPPGEEGGGILNALIGTGIIISLASIISIPPGIAAGIYMAERKGEQTLSTGQVVCRGFAKHTFYSSWNRSIYLDSYAHAKFFSPLRWNRSRYNNVPRSCKNN